MLLARQRPLQPPLTSPRRKWWHPWHWQRRHKLLKRVRWRQRLLRRRDLHRDPEPTVCALLRRMLGLAGVVAIWKAARSRGRTGVVAGRNSKWCNRKKSFPVFPGKDAGTGDRMQVDRAQPQQSRQYTLQYSLTRTLSWYFPSYWCSRIIWCRK